MAATRQQRRTRLRQLGQQGERLLKSGFPRQPSGQDLFAVGVALHDRLETRKGLAAVADFATASVWLYDATLTAHPGNVTVACKRGCNWCCYLPVAASVPEVLLAARAGRQGQAMAAIPTEAAVAGAGRKVACGLLREDGCGIYKARPMMCRVANSLDANACRDEYEGRNLDIDVPTARLPLEHGIAVRTAMLLALRLARLDDALYDLNDALGAAAQGEAVAARWLAGEKAFADARTQPLDATVAEIASRLMASYQEWAG